MPDKIDYAVTFGLALLILSAVAALPFLVLWRLPDWQMLVGLVVIASLWTRYSLQ